MIEAEGACAACRAKGVCGMAETQDKLVSVATTAAQLYRVGEKVDVSVQRKLGLKP